MASPEGAPVPLRKWSSLLYRSTLTPPKHSPGSTPTEQCYRARISPAGSGGCRRTPAESPDLRHSNLSSPAAHLRESYRSDNQQTSVSADVHKRLKELQALPFKFTLEPGAVGSRLGSGSNRLGTGDSLRTGDSKPASRNNRPGFADSQSNNQLQTGFIGRLTEDNRPWSGDSWSGVAGQQARTGNYQSNNSRPETGQPNSPPCIGNTQEGTGGIRPGSGDSVSGAAYRQPGTGLYQPQNQQGAGTNQPGSRECRPWSGNDFQIVVQRPPGTGNKNQSSLPVVGRAGSGHNQLQSRPVTGANMVKGGENRPISKENRSTNGENVPMAGDSWPVTGKSKSANRPKTGDNWPGDEENRPISGDSGPVIDINRTDNRPFTGLLPPITGAVRPGSENSRPITGSSPDQNAPFLVSTPQAMLAGRKSETFIGDRYADKPPSREYLPGDGLLCGPPQTPGGYQLDPNLVSMNTQNNNLQLEVRSIRLGFNPPIKFSNIEKPAPKKPLTPESKLGVMPLKQKTAEELAEEEKKRKFKEKFVRAKPPMSADGGEYEAKCSTSYWQVGHATRFSTFPLHSVKMESSSQAVHSDVVHLSRYPETDEFRMVKDAYGAWAEQNLVREKLKKLWNAPAAKT